MAPQDVWDFLIAGITVPGSIGELLDERPTLETIHASVELGAGANYTPPDDHLMTGIIVEDPAMLLEFQDKALQWRDLFEAAWCQDEFHRLGGIATNNKMRLHNGDVAARDYDIWYMVIV